MGGRVQKIAFIIFALLFVAIMAVLNTSVLNMATSSNKTLTTTVTTSDSSSLNVYDNTSVYGSTVQECAKNPGGIVSSALHVFVRTSGATGYMEYCGNGTYTQNDAGASDYINPNSMFKSNLITNSNGVTVGIVFYQDGVETPPTTDDLVNATHATGGPEDDCAQDTWQIVGLSTEGTGSPTE